MLFSAVSLAFVALAGVPQVSPVWSKIEASVGFVSVNGEVTGVAALVADEGLFLTHLTSVGPQGVKLGFRDGYEVGAILLASDDQTQLALVRALQWQSGKRKPLSVAGQTSTGHVPVLAVTAAGPITGEFVADGRAGVMRPSLRYVPLSEIRLDSSSTQIGGALVFNESGELFGVLGASLARQTPLENTSRGATREKSLGDAAASLALGNLGVPAFGPQGVTVSYALGREIVSRVVQGFTSPDHKVQHPTIGVFFKTSTSGRGVSVESVMAGSPAALAGLMPGDEIYDVDGTPVNNAVELAVALFRKNVGEKVTLRYGRGEGRTSVEVNVVSSQSTAGL